MRGIQRAVKESCVQLQSEVDQNILTPKVIDLSERRYRLDRKVDQLESTIDKSHALSFSRLGAAVTRQATLVRHGHLSSKLLKVESNMWESFSRISNELVDDTYRLDHARFSLSEEIATRRNPFEQVSRRFTPLCNLCSDATKALDKAISHIENAQLSKAGQMLTSGAQKGVGQLAHSAARGVEMYSHGMLSQEIGNVKLAVARVYDKARELQTTVLPRNWEGLDASSSLATYAGKMVLGRGILGSIAGFMNFASLAGLESELRKVRSDIIFLHEEAYEPVRAYLDYEEDRKKQLADIRREAQLELQRERVDGVCMNSIYNKAQRRMLGSRFKETKKMYDRAKILAAASLTLAFSGAAYGYLTSEEASPPASSEYVSTQHNSYN